MSGWAWLAVLFQIFLVQLESPVQQTDGFVHLVLMDDLLRISVIGCPDARSGIIGAGQPIIWTKAEVSVTIETSCKNNRYMSFPKT